MMQSLERHALYSSIRMNWLNDPTLKVEEWQVEDYRSLSLDKLFEKLKRFSVNFDKQSFVAYANECDSPEELSEHLLPNETNAKSEDQLYLVVFELWRRLMTEKPTLSIICSELDHQIYLHDQKSQSNPIPLQDALSNFALLLNENSDEGINPKDALELITPYFANDIVNFLHDYIYDLIDEDQTAQAQDILDNFAPYIKGNKWFDLLHVRLVEEVNPKLAKKLLDHLLEDYLSEEDLDFNLEVLAFLAKKNQGIPFSEVGRKTLAILETEEDFQDLLSLCLDFFHFLDDEKLELKIKTLLKNRVHEPIDSPLRPEDPDLEHFSKLLNSYKPVF